jgi:hypothetical protein
VRRSVLRVVAVRRSRRQDTVRGLQAGGAQPAVWHLARGEPEAAGRGDERGDVVAVARCFEGAGGAVGDGAVAHGGPPRADSR